MKKKLVALLTVFSLMVCIFTTACGSDLKDKIIIYSNADDEAVEVITKTLDENGFKDKYVIQSFGTSELGGKLLAEGKNSEADIVTMSSFYLETAQERNDMFADINTKAELLEDAPSYYLPMTSQEGTIIVNTQVLKENNLPAPKSIEDMADSKYKGLVSVTDVSSSSTAWLLIQAIINEYGEDEAKDILKGIYANAGAHIEESGSGPLKKVRAGEVAIGFGLRHQAVADKKEGLPVEFVDPTEGNFSLTESVALIDKGKDINKTAEEMAKCIIEKGRSGLLKYYPNPLYKGEKADKANMSTNPKVYKEKLTAELLEEHKKLSESCK